MKKLGLVLICVLGFFWVIGGALPALAAYSSHQNDQDVNIFLSVYPFARSTKLDDCSLCHPGGTVGGRTSGSCDYCHITYGLQEPHGQVPLNDYGLAYKDAGRNEAGTRSIEGNDSDGDGYNNSNEIQGLRFPGDAADHPGLVAAPAVVMNFERILKLPSHSQFLFYNASRSRDFYARYRGVKISDLLKYLGVPSGATQITVFAPDGFSRTFPIDAPDPQQNPAQVQYDVMGPYPNGYYYGGLDFVDYSYDPGYPDGNSIPDKLYMLLGYLRDGDPLDKGRLIPDPANPSRLVLEGEGLYRLIIPQKIAGSPDRGQNDPKQNDGWDYDSNKDHNAGFSVRSVSAIRVEPLPTGTTDFSWTEGGWNLVDKARVVVYGAINPRTYWVSGQVTNNNGNPVSGVKISFGLVNLGQVGETISDGNGKFRTRLPLGEYVMSPSKQGLTFDPSAVPFNLGEKGYQMNFTAVSVP